LSVADAAGGLTEFYEAGGQIEGREWDDLVSVVAERLGGASWLIMSGSLPRGAPAKGYAELIDAARAKGVAIALDTRGDSLVEALPAGPDIVKVNASEASDVLGSPVTTEGAAAAAVAMRSRAGGKGAAVLTLGVDGAVAAAGDEQWRARSDVRGHYSVGSGDAFLAGLVTALDRGSGWIEALALALGAGAANAEEPGAGRLQRERAEAIAAGANIVQLNHSAEE
jgi:fructose-1-phosphate kinase PfkB-like protein